jgi:excinuclease ABC subunit B
VEKTNRRRAIQLEYNRRHGITPQTIEKEVRDIVGELHGRPSEPVEIPKAAERLEFELAAAYRDKIRELRKLL